MWILRFCFAFQVGAVSILYIACTRIDPVDPRVHRSQEKYSPKKEAEAGPEEGRDEQAVEAGEQKKSSQQGNGCNPLGGCQRQPEDLDSDEELLYCSICDADVLYLALPSSFPLCRRAIIQASQI